MVQAAFPAPTTPAPGVGAVRSSIVLMSEFDYELPEDRIAQEPADPRDSARLLVDRGDGVAPDHAFVRDFDRFVEPGDVIVVNDTRVIAARLNLVKETGGAVEVFLLEPASDGRWSALVRPSRRVPDGSVLTDTTGRCSVVVEEAIDGGQRAVRVELDGRPVIDVESAGVLEKIGQYKPQDLEDEAFDEVRDELYYLLGKFNYGGGDLGTGVDIGQCIYQLMGLTVQSGQTVGQCEF